MSEVYRYFAKEWIDSADFSDQSLIDLFNAESYGTPCEPNNGFLLGKKWLNVTVKMWFEDIDKGLLFRCELYDDPNLPHWWLDSLFKRNK